MKPTVGLIGYGRFGRLAARYMATSADVIVSDRGTGHRSGGGVRHGAFAEVAAQPVVVLAVPISSMRGVLRRMRKHVTPGALVLDVCSVKVLPVRWMKNLLPPAVSIVGMHPLFGPDSDTGTLRGQRVVLCPVRARPSQLRALRRIAVRRGIRLCLMTPRDHDRLMAETLLVSHYVGRLVPAAGIRMRAWSTPSYDHLRGLVDVAGNDTRGLFRDMWKFNPYGRRLAARLRAAHGRLVSGMRFGSVDS